MIFFSGRWLSVVWMNFKWLIFLSFNPITIGCSICILRIRYGTSFHIHHEFEMTILGSSATLHNQWSLDTSPLYRWGQKNITRFNCILKITQVVIGTRTFWCWILSFLQSPKKDPSCSHRILPGTHLPGQHHWYVNLDNYLLQCYTVAQHWSHLPLTHKLSNVWTTYIALKLVIHTLQRVSFPQSCFICQA